MRMSISVEVPGQSPAVLLADAVAAVRGLAETLWSARSDDELVAVVDPDTIDRRLAAALEREERAAHLTRSLSISSDRAGGVRVRGRGSAEDGTRFWDALIATAQHALDTDLPPETHGTPPGSWSPSTTPPSRTTSRQPGSRPPPTAPTPHGSDIDPGANSRGHSPRRVAAARDLTASVQVAARRLVSFLRRGAETVIASRP
jgi:hypothetical protein